MAQPLPLLTELFSLGITCVFVGLCDCLAAVFCGCGRGCVYFLPAWQGSNRLIFLLALDDTKMRCEHNEDLGYVPQPNSNN
jgi:hypothetical protein